LATTPRNPPEISVGDGWVCDEDLDSLAHHKKKDH
jgi:hypothetical protein